MQPIAHPLQYPRFWIACGFGFIALVIYLSLAPEAPDIGSVEDIKANHLLAYGWMMFWFAQIYRRIPPKLGIALGLLALGIALEYLQRMTGYRTFRYSDMFTDGLGVTLGFLFSLGPLGDGLRTLERLLPRRA